MKSVAILAVVALLATPALGGPVYKWTDARGVVHFGDVPPHAPGVNAQTMPAPPPPVARPPQEPEATPTRRLHPGAAGEHGEGPRRRDHRSTTSRLVRGARVSRKVKNQAV